MRFSYHYALSVERCASGGQCFQTVWGGGCGWGITGTWAREGDRGWKEGGWQDPRGLSPWRSMVHTTASPYSSPLGWGDDWGAGKPAEISVASRQCSVKMHQLPKNDAGPRPSGATWHWCKTSVNTVPSFLHLFIHPSKTLSRIWWILKIFLSASFSSCFGGFYDFQQNVLHPTVFQVSALKPHIHMS